MGLKSKIKRLIGMRNKIYCNIYELSASKQLQNKNVVITGGASGIGKAVAKAATKAGAKVVIIGRNEEKLKAVCSQLNNCIYFVSDITKNYDYNTILKIEALLGGRIDVFINNAGIYVDNKYLEYSSEDFDTVISTNTKSAFFLAQNYIKYCKNNGSNGNLIFTTSNRSLMGDFGPYGMSKAAINNLIEGLARENIGSRIRVNGVAPGMTASGINGIKNTDDLYTDSAKGKRVLLAEEIAEVICFLSSDVSKCITGAIIPCDEGDRLR